jgi:hypothetical protein
MCSTPFFVVNSLGDRMMEFVELTALHISGLLRKYTRTLPLNCKHVGVAERQGIIA